MNARPLLKIGGAALLLTLSGAAAAKEPHMPFVRIAELEIDPARLESYMAAVREEMETSIRVEPGVLAIYAVAEGDRRSGPAVDRGARQPAHRWEEVTSDYTRERSIS